MYRVCIVDDDKLIIASVQVKDLVYKPKVRDTSGAGCIITDVPEETEDFDSDMGSSKKAKLILN